MVKLDYRASQSLSLEGIVAELKRSIQALRAQTGCGVTERISVTISAGDEYVEAAVRLNRKYLKQECLVRYLRLVAAPETAVRVERIKKALPNNKVHSPVALVNGELYYAKEGYPHYWAALDAWGASGQ